MKKFSSMMKKMIISILCLLVLAGCSKQWPKLIDCPDISSSMEEYYQTDCPNEIVTDHWQIKVLSIKKIERNEIKYYYYDVLLAPVTSQPTQIKKIAVSDNDYKAQEAIYGNKYQFMYLKDYNIIAEDLPMVVKIEEMDCYHVYFFLTNIHNEYQQKANLTDKQLDEKMKQPILKISYNLWDKDEIVLNYTEEIETIDQTNVDNQPGHILDLYYFGRLNRIFTTYSQELVKNSYYQYINQLLSSILPKEEDFIIKDEIWSYRLIKDNSEGTEYHVDKKMFSIYSNDQIKYMVVFDAAMNFEKLIDDKELLERFDKISDGDYYAYSQPGVLLFYSQQDTIIFENDGSVNDELLEKISTQLDHITNRERVNVPIVFK